MFFFLATSLAFILLFPVLNPDYSFLFHKVKKIDKVWIFFIVWDSFSNKMLSLNLKKLIIYFI